MVARLNRNEPLPDVPRVRVEDSTMQRALDALLVPLRAVVQFLQPYVQPEKWRTLDFFDDWGRGSTANKIAQARKDPLGYIELRGEAKTVAGTATTLGTLPVGSRPFVVMSFPATVYDAGIVSGRVDINPDGRVVLVDPAVAANIEVYLDGIRFSPEA